MMNKKEIFRKIGGIISELTEQYQYLSDNFEDFNELELELFAANAHFLTEHIEILKKLGSTYKPDDKNATPAVQEVKGATEKETEVPETAEKWESVSSPSTQIVEEKQPLSESVLKFDFTPQNTTAEKSLDELYTNDFAKKENEPGGSPVSPVETIIKDPEPVPAPVVASAPVEVNPSEAVVNKVIIPEKNVQVESNQPEEKETPVRTINDVISSQLNKSTVSTAYTHQTTDDLKSIISLNDKLIFIKDLFNGYSLAYSEAIEILNRFDSLEAAENFLRNNYAEKNHWISKQSTVDKFLKLLARRYSR